ncbi:MAG: NADH-quinone oxidoreductase subunit N [Deltaproteobacteria bacterium]|nr:NADH-quinone oxidoreductase subunit N [Deltaproteobacteria bacterium]
MSITLADLAQLLPVWILVATGLLLLMYEVFANQADRSHYANISVVGFVLALWATYSSLGSGTAYLFGQGATAPLILDGFARAGSLLLLSGGLIATLLSPAYAKNAGHDTGEYYALIVFAVVGMMVMVMAGDLMTFFLGLETMSIAVYALTGLRAGDARSIEAALKYFLMGAFATGFLLFGIAMVYGATGSVALVDLARFLSASDSALSANPILLLGVVLILIGFAFKVAAVPFHMWAPDVYEGAPTPVAGFMAVGVKAAAFLALLRLVMVALGSVEAAPWLPMLRWVSILTILGGNLMALSQSNVKRMLAYSSVSHAGYAMIGIVAAAKGETTAGNAVLFYLTGYTFMTLGAFGVLAFLERKEGGPESERFGAYAGVGFKHPAMGAAMVLFMIALAGMPPTGGFFGKLYLFSAAIRANELPLALVGIAGSLVSVYYYLRVLVHFYMREVPEPGPTPTATRSTQLSLGVALSAALILILGVFPSQWVQVSAKAVASIAAATF